MPVRDGRPAIIAEPYSQSSPRILLEHSRCPSSRHRVHLRPRGDPVAPAGPAAAGAPLPDAHPVVFAARDPGEPLHQLAAGPAGQLRRAPHLPRQGAQLSRRGRPGRRDGGLQPVRLLPRAVGRAVPLRLRRGAAPRARTVPAARAADAPAARLPGRDRPHAAPHHRRAGRTQPAAPDRRPLSGPPRTGRSDGRRDASTAVRVVPRHDVVARAVVSSPRSGCALCVRLPPSARRRREAGQWTGGTGTGLHRSPRLVRGLPAWRRMGGVRPDVGPARRRRAPAAGLHARSGERRAHHRCGGEVREHLPPRDVGAAHRRVAPGDEAVLDRAVVEHRGARSCGGRRPRAARRAPDDGR